jgi:D-serine deaminase-like pyridoxal phosphate-dependent protein
VPTLISDLETPALLVDLQRLEANLRRYQAIAREQEVSLRPHAKTHKSVAVAREQREHGCRGLTVAKPSEAEVFVAAGFDDVRIAYPVVGEVKWSRILRMMRSGARISFCVDTPEGARGASAFFEAAGEAADVLVEVDTGHGRSGIRWDRPDAPDFLHLVQELKGLRLVGLLTHGGHSYRGPAEGETPIESVRRVMAEERDHLLAFAERCYHAGALHPDAELSLGSTPTVSVFENRTVGEGDGVFRITEIRPGNYVFHDAQQVALGSATLADCALTVLATVISVQRDPDGGTRLFLDAGKKVLTTDLGYGVDGHGILLYDPIRMTLLPHAHITALSEEHAWVGVSGAATLEVGDHVRVVPNHACVTVATADEVHVVSGEEVVATWAVDARGALR